MTAEKSFWEKNIVESPFKVGLLAVPFLLSLFVGWYLIGSDDTKYVLIWCAYLLLCGVAVLPLGAYIFRNVGSGGFILTQTMGVVLVSIFVWTFTYIKIYRFNRILVFVAVFLIGIACYVIPPLRREFIKTIRRPFYIEKASFELLVFMLVLTILCYYKGFTPIINGQEKFMDYGFIMSMLRNGSLPANDMWLAGYSINYYYFGQYIWAVVIKATNIPSGVGYNLAMCSATALPFAMSFSIGKFMIEAASKRGFKDNRIIKYIAGFFTGCAVSLWGNSHSFYYDEKSVGNSLLEVFKNMGIDVGRTDRFFYPDSTRFIGWNPDLGVDYTIEEFPFYSYIVGDLHAHVISMIIVLLISAIILSMICTVKLPSKEETELVHSLDNLGGDNNSRLLPEFESTITLHLVLCAVLLGCAQMTNYWDFLIYFVFCSMGVLICNTIRSPKFTNIPGAIVFLVNVGGILLIYLAKGSSPAVLFALEALLMIASFLFCVVSPTALPRTSFQMSFLFTIASFVALPFNLNFDMISNSLGKCKNHSSLFQLFILYGIHVLISVVFMVIVFVNKNYRAISTDSSKKNRKHKNTPGIIGEEHTYTNPIQAFFAQRNIIDIYCCGMTVVGIMLLIAPEIFYVRDIYTGGYLRSNTMFKFAFAAFIILSTTMIYSVIRLFWFIKKDGKKNIVLFCVAIGFAINLFIPAHYTMLALKQRSGELKRENYKTLDGTAYIEKHASLYVDEYYSGNLVPYMVCVDWFNENVKGSPVICESYGDSYTDYCIISAYTGLPTVFGWQTHEWLWRFHGVVNKETDLLESDPEKDVWKLYITPRHNDVDILYLSSNPSDVQGIVDKYQIEYIIVGDLERHKYGYDNSPVFAQLGNVIFQYEDLMVYKVTPSVAAT